MVHCVVYTHAHERSRICMYVCMIPVVIERYVERATARLVTFYLNCTCTSIYQGGTLILCDNCRFEQVQVYRYIIEHTYRTYYVPVPYYNKPKRNRYEIDSTTVFV